jgi:ABC-2 type transport system permease protein
MFSFNRVVSDLAIYSRRYMRNITGLFFSLIFPVLIVIVFGAISTASSTDTITVYAQNQDVGPFAVPQMDVASQYLTALNQTGTVNIQLIDHSANFTEYLLNHSTTDGIIIPTNFSADYLSGHQLSVTLYGNPASSTSSIVEGTVNGVNNYFNLQRYNGTQTISVIQSSISVHQTKYVDYLIPGLIGFSILVSPMFSLVNVSSEYKKNGLFKQLSLTPLSKIEWLASKVIWYIIISGISFLVTSTVGIVLFDADMTFTVWLIPFFILGPMLFASIGMLVGTLAKSPETAGTIGNVITFPMMFLSGTFFPLSVMPQYLQSLAHVLPLFYVVEGLNNVMLYGNISAALVDISVLGVLTVLMFTAATKLFKWRED